MKPGTVYWWDMILTTLWNATVIGVCTYLVFWKDYSGWWFLLAFILMCSINPEVKLAYCKDNRVDLEKETK